MSWINYLNASVKNLETGLKSIIVFYIPTYGLTWVTSLLYHVYIYVSLHFLFLVVCKCFILCDSRCALPWFCAHVGDIVGNHPSLKMMSMCVCVCAIKGVSERGYIQCAGNIEAFIHCTIVCHQGLQYIIMPFETPFEFGRKQLFIKKIPTLSKLQLIW